MTAPKLINFRHLIPATVRKWVHDRLQYFFRKYPPKAVGIPYLNLSATQVYPHGKNILHQIKSAIKVSFSGLAIDQQTPTASIGTCFAEEFSTYIMNSGGNYLYKERNTFNSSANWGRVYTIPNLYQIVQYSTSKSFPYHVEQCTRGFFDPLRERSVGYCDTYESALSSIKEHRNASESVLLGAELLVITLGQNEAWVDREKNIVWGSMPPGDLLGKTPDRFVATEFGYKENIQQLESILQALAALNNKLKVIFTISPVAAHATFLSNDVVTQSFAGKCMLRTVVHDVIRGKCSNAFYFPSFEIVFCDNPKKFRADNRHVKYATVGEIFSILGNAINK